MPHILLRSLPVVITAIFGFMLHMSLGQCVILLVGLTALEGLWVATWDDPRARVFVLLGIGVIIAPFNMGLGISLEKAPGYTVTIVAAALLFFHSLGQTDHHNG